MTDKPLTPEEEAKVRHIVAMGGYLTASMWGRRLLATLDATLQRDEDPQIIYLSNAGDETSIVLNSLRDRAAEDPRLAYLEWSAAPDRADDDRDGWAEANPAIGHIPTLQEQVSYWRSLYETCLDTTTRLARPADPGGLRETALEEVAYRAELVWESLRHEDHGFPLYDLGRALATLAATPTEDAHEEGRPPLDPLVAAHDRGWSEGFIAGRAAAPTADPGGLRETAQEVASGLEAWSEADPTRVAPRAGTYARALRAALADTEQETER
jgi:hypothetical protein